MNPQERLMLQKMIKANDVEDQTELIRELKHSHLLEKDINALLKIKNEKREKENEKKKVENLDELPEDYDERMTTECSFLFSNYTDLFNKIKKNEIDLKILNHFINILRNIEDGEIDQHEGSYLIGHLLKQLYVDSALKKATKLNDDENSKPRFLRPSHHINYKNFKQNL